MLTIGEQRPETQRRMIDQQIRERGIDDPRVLAALEAVPREAFVPTSHRHDAHADRPLSIGLGQTISQPYIVALMTEALAIQPADRVLEIGTGSGYGAAVLGQLGERVYTVERWPELANVAARRLAGLGYANIEVRCGDGTLGWPEHAPYQAISVTAAGPQVPRPLLDQLAIGGRLVMPTGPFERQRLLRVTRRSEDDYAIDDLGAVQFVPLVGERGWQEGASGR